MNIEFGGIVKVWEKKLKKSQATTKKRLKSIFTAMSVVHVDDEEVKTPGVVYHVEKVFSNGDMYMGEWADKCPNGNGKCLWSDGCMYVGDWYRGRPMDKGKFSWPSGATYEGNFKNGYMDGEGTYTGSSNDYYRGAWVYNIKHGKGVCYFANGDFYEGQWRRGQPDGKGRYHWTNGNQYIGHWRRGSMNGNGTMIWDDGNRYDGCWESGFPRGNGTFKWVDGSFYAGVWSQDANEQSGTYYPSNSQTGTFDWDPQEVYFEKLSDCVISDGEEISVFPSDKSVNWPCGEMKQSPWLDYKESDTKTTRASEDVRLSNGGFSFRSESEFSFNGANEHFGSKRDLDDQATDPERSAYTKPQIIIKPTKRQGTTISKDHKNYELMLNLQLGIRHSVGRAAPSTSLDLKSSAFDPRNKVWTRFPTEGSKHTPPHQSCEFKWKDYCPLVFRTLRKLFKVDPADYMLSICGNDALRELSSPGKSGSFFYLTNDDKYMIKTMKKSEVKVFTRMLQSYYKHVRSFEETLVTKFFGLHCVKLVGPAQKKVRFVIMGNLFCTEYPIHRRFDLKGSSHGRITEKPESEIEPTTVLKDLDLNFIFRLQKPWFQDFCRQVEKDCEFLEQERIMDYSLLVGIHFREVSESGEPLSTSQVQALIGTDEQSNEVGASPLSGADMGLLFGSSRGTAIRLGANMPIRAELSVRRNQDEPQLVGEPTGEFYDVILVFGIIDILQDYDINKKLEHAYKSFQYDATSISAVDPIWYAKRFRDFMFKVFTEETS